MEKMGLNEIRQKYLKFFESKGHLIMPSFSLVPKNDRSLLLINAGMAPLKPYFTGQEVPPSKRVTTCQKCVRTGDIDRVGKTSRHGTFFEMLGNFSFGDYFKAEVIPWAWEFVTGVLQIPKDKLYVTIYTDDDEAYDLWKTKTDIDPKRIFRLGREDNFWEHGQGPCGPCSEIHYDRGEGKIESLEDFIKAGDEDRVIEFWNLVFTQFDKDSEGNYNRLKNPNIDTGMGLERIATIMQGVNSIFEVDTIKDILQKVCETAGVLYGTDRKKDVSLRIVTDHIRSVTFMVSDGILPSNEGRGYVLRRLLRRAARHGKLLGIQGEYLYRLCDTVIENSKEAYPELKSKQEYIKKIIRLEEERFNETLDQGTLILNQYVDDMKLKGENTLSGVNTFKLYDTYGFPIELTEEILSEQGMDVDSQGFEAEMKSQRERARSAREVTNYMGRDLDVYSTLPADVYTDFKGYDTLKAEGKVLFIIKDGNTVDKAGEGDEISIILDSTPFYSEMGGQVGDTGTIENDNVKVSIADCKKTANGKVIHLGTVEAGEIAVGDTAMAIVDSKRRMSIARNHTATHLLQAALRQVLGSHIEQAGSLVTPDRLRFDFTHFEAISSADLLKVEKLVNEKILGSLPVKTIETGIDEAIKMGATALFGEKYGARVRVVSAGDFSMELCGGTHVYDTSQIGLFKIISESGVASGVRRIEAVTGAGALKYVEGIEEILNQAAAALKTPVKEIVRKAESLFEELKEKEKIIEELKSKMAANAADDIVKDARDVKGIKVAAARVNLDVESMRELGDRIKEKLGKSVVVLSSTAGGKIVFIAMASKDAAAAGAHAGNIVKEVAKITGGGGGGKPEMAQAGGKDPEKIDEALNASYNIIGKMIK